MMNFNFFLSTELGNFDTVISEHATGRGVVVAADNIEERCIILEGVDTAAVNQLLRDGFVG